MKKRIFVFFMAVVLLLAFTGCNMIKVNKERDGKQVVATVNGEPILKSTVLESAELYASYYGYSETDSEYGDVVDQLSESYLETEIENTICKIKCKEYGIELTDEQREELDTTMQTVYDNYYSIAENNYPEEDYPDEEERQKLIDEYAKERLDSIGYNDGSYEQNYIDGYLKENLKEYLAKDYNPTDDDVKEFYDQELADQKQILDSSLSQLETIESDSVLVYVPEGIRYVRNLLIAIPEDKRTEITQLRSDDKDEEADALQAEELAKLKDRADEAYAAALVDFDAALAEYGEDPGMEDEETGKTGYRIYSGNSTYDTIFTDAGMALEKVGDVSEPTGSDYGYYIIEYTSQMKAGAKPFEEVKEELREYMVEKNLTETYDVNLGIWLEEMDIVRYPNRLKYIG